MKKQFTREEKQIYFKGLREQWAAAKAIANNGKGDEIRAIIATHGMNISVTGYLIVSNQMKALGLDGLPYLDAKTFQGWKDNGFKVRKGEKSQISGITWIGINTAKEDEDNTESKSYAMPKAYHLFHRTQVDAI